MMTLLSRLQEASRLSSGDHSTSITLLLHSICPQNGPPQPAFQPLVTARSLSDIVAILTVHRRYCKTSLGLTNGEGRGPVCRNGSCPAQFSHRGTCVRVPSPMLWRCTQLMCVCKWVMRMGGRWEDLWPQRTLRAFQPSKLVCSPKTALPCPKISP